MAWLFVLPAGNGNDINLGGGQPRYLALNCHHVEDFGSLFTIGDGKGLGQGVIAGHDVIAGRGVIAGHDVIADHDLIAGHGVIAGPISLIRRRRHFVLLRRWPCLG